MLHGVEKRRQMARSVLPATASRRKGARTHLRIIGRAHRRNARQALRNLGVEVDDEGESLAAVALANVGSRRLCDIRHAVAYRREADNIGPLLRWAPEAVAHLHPIDRLPTLRSWLPDGLIGWHAMQHVIWADVLCDDEP